MTTARGTRAFVRGMARALDLGATSSRRLQSVHHSSFAADARALSRDWVAVGGELRNASKVVKGQIEKERAQAADGEK